MRQRKEWKFFAALHAAAPTLASAWWMLVVLRGLAPAVTSLAFGWLVGALASEAELTDPFLLVGATFALSVVVQPLHQVVSSNVGSRMAAHLYDRLTRACVAPAGTAHLERPELASDLVVARDFDQATMGPPLSVSMDYISGGLVQLVVGAASACLLLAFHWWAALLLVAAWTSTHWLLRESGVWRDRNTPVVRAAQRQADYAYRLAVDSAPAKELRLFGLAGWAIERFVSARRHLYELQHEATRLRERPLLASLVVVLSANALLFWLLADAARTGALSTGRIVVFVQAAIGVSAIAFGGLNWALDWSSTPVEALGRLEAAAAEVGALTSPGGRIPPATAPEVRFRGLCFSYEKEGKPVLERLDLLIPAGSSLAIVGQNGAGKTTLAKLLCRLYDPSEGRIEIDGVPLTELDLDAWRSRVTAVFQDFVRFELPLRANVAPHGADDEDIRAALRDAGGEQLAGGRLDTILSKGYRGGTDLSGGQWQRVALARALCAVRQGAKLVLLDEPTAQLDVRGEAEIFERVLRATRGCTTILVSHRFSTVRQADRICVLEGGRVVELGSHAELMAQGGRYRRMFDLQASRFGQEEIELDERGQQVRHDSL